MSCPARMSHPEGRRRQRMLAQHLFEIGQLSGLPPAVDLVCDYYGYAGAVVPAVLKSSQTFEYHVDRILPADIANDSAHADTVRSPRLRPSLARSADGAPHDVRKPLGSLLRTLRSVSLDHYAHQRLGPARSKQHPAVIAKQAFLFSHSCGYRWRVNTQLVDTVDIQKHLRVPLHDGSEVGKCLA